MTDLSILERKVGSLTFANPLVLGGGTCKTLDDTRKACRTDVGGIELGTITPEMRSGNAGPNVFYAHYVGSVLVYTLNSLGMPNSGREAVSTWAREAIAIAHGSGKKIGVNVAADATRGIVEMVVWALEMGFDWVTINAGCPNKYDANGKPLSVLCYDGNGVGELFVSLGERLTPGQAEVWWKPGPFTDSVNAFTRHADLVDSCPIITGYIANNTVAHCYSFDEDGEQSISPGGGLAGMAGPAAKPIALGHLSKLSEHKLSASKALIGAGGVVAGCDLSDHMRCGASIVHFASAVWAANMNYGVANEILAQFMDDPHRDTALGR